MLVFSQTLEDHAEHLRQVFELLRRDQWKVKWSKCMFGQQQITYLGHVISAEGVATDLTKIEAVAAWPTPTSVKEVRQFLGLAGYYCRFVRHFGMLACPLFKLLKNGTLFVWTKNTEQSFQLLKNRLISSPVLAVPNFKKQYTVETDACDTGIGAVLQQEEHPIAFMSKSLCPKYRGLSTYEKEYLVIIAAIDQWRPYLQSAEFVIKMDQCSLVYLQEQCRTTPWQQRAFTKLLGLQYKIIYKKGSENSAADTLSCLQQTEQVWGISSCQPSWLDDIVASYNSNPQAQRLLEQLTIRPDPKGRDTPPTYL